jgi:hypothetical protein
MNAMRTLSKTDRKRLAVLQRQYERLLAMLPADPKGFDPRRIDDMVLISEEMLAIVNDQLAILGEADVEP